MQGIIFLSSSWDDNVCVQQRTVESCLSITPDFTVKIAIGSDDINHKCKWIKEVSRHNYHFCYCDSLIIS